MKMAFVKWIATRPFYRDDMLVAQWLEAQGVECHWLDAQADVDWTQFDAVSVKSCAGYYDMPAAFDAWLKARQAEGTRLVNPGAAVRWNLDKHYLRDLEAKGIAVLPTEWLQAGERVALATVMARRGWTRAVGKLAIGAGGWNTFTATEDEAEARQPMLDALLAKGDVILQPFAEEIVRDGEWSFVFLDGAFAYSLVKRPAAGNFLVQESHGGTTTPVDAPPALVAQAEAVVQAAPGPLAYARVDGLVRDGRLWLMELEIIEPWLWLWLIPQAAERYGAVLQRWAGSTAYKGQLVGGTSV